MKRVILLSVLLSSLALARYYEFDLEKVSDPFAQESYGIPQDHEVDLADVKVPWGLIGEAGWVQIGYEKDERLRIISLNENLTPREPEISIWKGRIFAHHRIWESSNNQPTLKLGPMSASKPNRCHSLCLSLAAPFSFANSALKHEASNLHRFREHLTILGL